MFVIVKAQHLSGRSEECGSLPKLLQGEDDDSVRTMLQAVLERDGFEVAAVSHRVRRAPVH